MTSTTIHRLILVLVAVAGAEASLANDAAPDKATPNNAAADAKTPSAAALICELGSEEFDVRENAAKSLVAMGLAAEDELREALREPDLEIRLRANQLLSRIYRADLDRRLSAFIEGEDDQLANELDGWRQFREIVGDDRKSRATFAEIYRREEEMLAAINRPPQEREAILLARIERAQQELYGRSGGGAKPPSAETMAAVLLLAAQKDTRQSIHGGVQTYSLLSHSQVKNLITSGEQSAVLHKLVNAWVASSTEDSHVGRYALMVGLQYDLKDASLELARKLVAAKNVSTSMIPYAILAIGKYGGRSDVDRLEPLLANKTVCHRWHNGKFPNTIEIQVRDVALAVLVQLTGKDHKQYGFDLLQPNESTLFHIYTCGFVENKQREAAMAKWQGQSS